ncbi:MAG: translation initiation factor IF-2 [Planctomycetota bacterium]
MAKAFRVHQLAKELGVKSKVIVEKCEAEGVPDITNHMSTVKLGLAETIRQWFGETDADHSTAIEEAEKVDLTKVRKKAARKKAKASKKPADEAPPAESETATAVMDPPAETPAEPAAAAPGDDEPADDSAAPVEAPVAEAMSVEEAAAASKATARKREAPVEEAKPAPVTPVGQQNVPTRPDVVKPAGEQVKPQEAKLSGPKVVRVEKPEPAPTPRPRGPRPSPGGGGGQGGPAPGEVEGITRSRGPSRGGGVRGIGGDAAPAPGGPAGPGGRRRGGGGRSMNTRRDRSSDALPSGPSQFSKADLEELDARLKGASGFLKQRRRDMTRRGGGQQAQSAAETGGKVEVAEPITIKGLSAATGIKTGDIIKYLFTQKKVMATVNSAIDTEAAMEIALEYDIELVVKEQETAEAKVQKQFADRKAVDVRPRPAVVTILGHVDHGKTSLLDRIRKADVAAHEDGGITQHIGAYRVTVAGSDGQEKSVVFLDTPGHEAFTTMRARGAKMTDIAVIVCAADDGVMPQTIESINHAKAAGVPVIVALNKTDLPQATEENIQKIYGQLAEHGLNPVPWGGETEVVKTSAETGDGITELIELIDLQAEVMELTADYGGPARGTVIEAEMQAGRGSVARVLIQDGQIKVGGFISIGRAFGRVRDMTDDRNRRIKEAGPATPLELSGIDEIPDAGDRLYVTDSLKEAEGIALQIREDERNRELASQTKVTLDNFAATVAAGGVKELRVVLKCDVQGSVETLNKSLSELGNDEVAVRVIHSQVGGITESDVLLADASDAIVVGFHVVATPAVREIAESRSVDIRLYRVIYEAIDEVKLALEGMLTPEKSEIDSGTAEVKQTFKIGGVGNIAGCLVTDGAMRRDELCKVIRDGVIVTADRKLSSLRRVKDEAKEVQVGTECGIRIEGFEDVKPGDQIVCYRVEEVKRKLD